MRNGIHVTILVFFFFSCFQFSSVFVLNLVLEIAISGHVGTRFKSTGLLGCLSCVHHDFCRSIPAGAENPIAISTVLPGALGKSE